VHSGRLTAGARTIDASSDHSRRYRQLHEATHRFESGRSEQRQRVTEIVRHNGLIHFDEPVHLASGELSHDFVDGKAALAHGGDLASVCRVMLTELEAADISFESVGGLTMGADQFAHGIAVLASCDWFVVRKQPKNRGTNQLIEGARLREGTRVLLVDDVVTTGGSIQRAYEAVVSTGASVVAAATLVDRGDVAGAFFDGCGVPYLRLVTYADLDIPAVGGGLVTA
jgi:orotate phosphoribosyltransferase